MKVIGKYMITIANDYKGISSAIGDFLHYYNTKEEVCIQIIPASDSEGMMPLNTPFGCNTLSRRGKNRNVFYDENIINKCGLSLEEEIACILHEIGHILDGFKPEKAEIEKEKTADNFAAEAGYSYFLMTALSKMLNKLDLDSKDDVEKRIQVLSTKTYYRPEWTSGSYNQDKRTAILYNLIEGVSHFFEDLSADVIGKIIVLGRNQVIDLRDLAASTNLEITIIEEFALQLCDLGLLTKCIVGDEYILEYRKQVAMNNILNYNKDKVMPNGVETMELGLEGAEEDYAKSIDGWTNIVFELTYRCSEKCIHCYNVGSAHYDTDVDKRGDRKELTLDEYKCVIDELKQQGMFKICLTGGDPFSKSEAWDIIRYCYEKEIAVELYTNGYAITNKIEKLIKMYPRIVGLTIYSPIAEVHDKITRIPGSFDKTLSSMSQLSSYGVPLQLKCCVFNVNFETYKGVYKLAEKYAALPQIEVNIKNSIDGNKYASKELRLNDEQYEELFKDSNIYPNIKSDTLDRLEVRDMNINACRAGVKSCTLTPEGNVIPCPAFHMVLGNVRDSSLANIRKCKQLEEWSKVSLRDYNECGTHKYCSLCAICPGENYTDTGSPLKASENKCFMAKKRYEYAKKIYKG